MWIALSESSNSARLLYTTDVLYRLHRQPPSTHGIAGQALSPRDRVLGGRIAEIFLPIRLHLVFFLVLGLHSLSVLAVCRAAFGFFTSTPHSFGSGTVEADFDRLKSLPGFLAS